VVRRPQSVARSPTKRTRSRDSILASGLSPVNAMGQRTTTLALHQAQPLTHPHISSHCLSFSLYPTHTHTRIQTGSAPSEIGTRIWTGSEEPERASERASEREREREREKERCFIDKTERKIEKRERSSLSSTPVWERERERERESLLGERLNQSLLGERFGGREGFLLCCLPCCLRCKGGRERERKRERESLSRTKLHNGKSLI